ncbi:GNAT family N-acetyltransferase [Nesterenkonia haasae]|uniref:GNAT family N-acetyltransferase n=1 Tax=Nesterenkonia haasae TaxID=2587813 RepID=UPI0013909302|nr:GNAT family N-acetyltransferase [Nesterenkonia haasae]NDK30947.1 GNAT family N-acetyltransferase [Nesterenkonia haasae]
MTFLDTLMVADAEYSVTRAVADDVPQLVALLRDDPLGAQRETASAEQYLEAFHQVDADPQQYLLVLRNAQDDIVGTAQVTFIPYLVRGGTMRLHIEAVRLAARERGRGLGSAFFDWIHQFGRDRGARLAQLTSDNDRADALRFYENLGYTPSHVGYKRTL